MMLETMFIEGTAWNNAPDINEERNSARGD